MLQHTRGILIDPNGQHTTPEQYCLLISRRCWLSGVIVLNQKLDLLLPVSIRLKVGQMRSVNIEDDVARVVELIRRPFEASRVCVVLVSAVQPLVLLRG